MLEEVEAELESRISQARSTLDQAPHLGLFIDDYHVLSARVEEKTVMRLENLLRRGQDVGITVFLSVPSLSLSGAVDGVLRRLRATKCGLWLTSTDAVLAQAAGVSIPIHWKGKQLPVGRGFLYHPGHQVMLQVAIPKDGEEKYVTQIVNSFEKEG